MRQAYAGPRDAPTDSFNTLPTNGIIAHRPSTEQRRRTSDTRSHDGTAVDLRPYPAVLGKGTLDLMAGGGEPSPVTARPLTPSAAPGWQWVALEQVYVWWDGSQFGTRARLVGDRWEYEGSGPDTLGVNDPSRSKKSRRLTIWATVISLAAGLAILVAVALPWMQQSLFISGQGFVPRRYTGWDLTHCWRGAWDDKGCGVWLGGDHPASDPKPMVVAVMVEDVPRSVELG